KVSINNGGKALTQCHLQLHIRGGGAPVRFGGRNFPEYFRLTQERRNTFHGFQRTICLQKRKKSYGMWRTGPGFEEIGVFTRRCFTSSQRRWLAESRIRSIEIARN